MKNNELLHLFTDGLMDALSAEHQIIKSLPKLIKLVSSPDLKEAMSKHLAETENQVTRIEQIFSILGMPAKEKTCEAMKGLAKEADEMVEGKSKSAILDVTIISALQKVEHYEIASYGTLRSFARHLGLDSEVIDLINESLEEEGNANKALTKIADGTIFTTGVNKEAAGQHAKR